MAARFEFCESPPDLAALARSLADGGCGGYVSFEGWVRDENEGQRVTRLEYEAYVTLAVREGERIIDEAVRRFGVSHARCVHRVGSLAIGDLAVWVGVSSPHRGVAVAACRYIIDEVKHRVPIWKKEHYVNGDSGWVNCERCAAVAHDHQQQHDHDHGHDRAGVAAGTVIVSEASNAATSGAAASTPSRERGCHPHFDYSRQTILPEVGEAGQAKLAAARVLVVGAGGLGCPVLQYLAGAGVGHLTILDSDRIEATNLHRQPLYALADVGRWKAEVAAERLRAQNPAIDVESEVQTLDAGNADRWFQHHDLVIDCTDNFRAKFLLNDAAVRAGKPAIFASIHQYEGQLQVVRPDRNGSCLRCVWPDALKDGVVGNCREAGVLGAVPAVLGSLQAVEALKLLLDLPGQLTDAILLVNLLDLTQRRIRAPRAAECAGGTCSRCARHEVPAVGLELDTPLAAARGEGLVIVDIRDDDEVAAQPIAGGALHIPMNRLLADPALLGAQDRYLLVCSRGLRSLAAVEQLRGTGRSTVWSLRGGLAAQR
ncbi:MAG: ThiF family adenylyltransferase [Steroidobacteraceae bacterium]